MVECGGDEMVITIYNYHYIYIYMYSNENGNIYMNIRISYDNING